MQRANLLQQGNAGQILTYEGNGLSESFSVAFSLIVMDSNTVRILCLPTHSSPSVSAACLQSNGVHKEAGPAEVCLVYFYLETLSFTPLLIFSHLLSCVGSRKQVAILLYIQLS